MSDLIPDVNSAGTFVLDAPFDKALKDSVPYTCVAVRKLDDIVALGIDPKAQYYDSPYQISADRYQSDLKNNVCIISLQSPTGEVVYVPSSYIRSFPKGGGVLYTTVALAISLSALPKTTDLSYLKQQMTDMVLSTLGIDSTVNVLTLSNDTLISQDSHNSIESARKAKITNNETDRAARLRLEAANAVQATKIQQLEQYILSLKKTP